MTIFRGLALSRFWVPYDTFAKALTGSGYQDCEFESFVSKFTGTKAENKEELVPVPDWEGRQTEGWQARALAPFEVDGWHARSTDIDNHHRSVRKTNKETSEVCQFQNVVFFRHVHPETGEPVL